MIIYVICGLPGSGKTTLSNKLSQQYDAKLYCYDNFKREFQIQDSRQIHQKLYNIIISDLSSGYNVILDDLHTRLEWRKSLLAALQNTPCKKKLIVMTTPLEECLYRNSQRKRQTKLPDSVIYHLNQRYQPPSLEEGWDDIQYV